MVFSLISLCSTCLMLERKSWNGFVEVVLWNDRNFQRNPQTHPWESVTGFRPIGGLNSNIGDFLVLSLYHQALETQTFGQTKWVKTHLNLIVSGSNFYIKPIWPIAFSNKPIPSLAEYLWPPTITLLCINSFWHLLLARRVFRILHQLLLTRHSGPPVGLVSTLDGVINT